MVEACKTEREQNILKADVMEAGKTVEVAKLKDGGEDTTLQRKRESWSTSEPAFPVMRLSLCARLQEAIHHAIVHGSHSCRT